MEEYEFDGKCGMLGFIRYVIVLDCFCENLGIWKWL